MFILHWNIESVLANKAVFHTLKEYVECWICYTPQVLDLSPTQSSSPHHRLQFNSKILKFYWITWILPMLQFLKKQPKKNKAQLNPRAWEKISLTLLKENVP